MLYEALMTPGFYIENMQTDISGTKIKTKAKIYTRTMTKAKTMIYTRTMTKSKTVTKTETIRTMTMCRSNIKKKYRQIGKYYAYFKYGLSDNKVVTWEVSQEWTIPSTGIEVGS